MAVNSQPTTNFPCSLTIHTPFPDHRLASTALRAIQVDAELSPLVRRTLSLTDTNHVEMIGDKQEEATVLKTVYRATTNRMLRVAVNGFMESLGVVLQIMQELDLEVLESDDGGRKEEEETTS